MAQTKEVQESLSPQEIKELLKEGNRRFVKGNMEKRNLRAEIKAGTSGQYPHTVVLGCIDSRVNSALIFDVGIGDIFMTRVAGGVISDDVLGSLEFACELAGSKLIVVLGHTNCGAVTAACNEDECGHITQLLDKIKPAVEKVKPKVEDITSVESINKVVDENVLNSMHEIRQKSPILRRLEEQGKIKIAGGVYDIHTGEVEFFIGA